MNEVLILKALSDKNRLQIMRWLKDPKRYFPHAEADVTRQGVCCSLIQQKLGLSQPSVSRHLKILEQAKLVIPTKSTRWVFYKRNNAVIKTFTLLLKQDL